MSIKELSSKTIYKSEKFAEVMSGCYTLLKHAPQAEAAREFLKFRIGAGPAIVSFGWFPPSEHLQLLTDLVGEQILLDLDLIYKKRINDYGHQRYVNHCILNNNNLIMPYHNVYGDIIGLVGRTLLSSQEQKEKKVPKYKNTNLTKMLNLFAFHKAKEGILNKKHAIIVEGQFDCITCHRYGLNNVVAVGGTSFTKYHFFLLRRYTDSLYFAFDNDDAGELAYQKIENRYGGFARINKIHIDKRYKDIDEALIKGGRDILNYY